MVIFLVPAAVPTYNLFVAKGKKIFNSYTQNIINLQKYIPLGFRPGRGVYNMQ